ncbi:MAG TPA: UDP-N-acetylmuramoyl-L-alanine--D-glutamate ligase, partial [bacterium]|nr:UDP-N-acetylmuramoyl-L-alanine--D-glutamate ligase [bacterium]
VETGAHTRQFAEGVDFMVVSPGVPDSCPVLGWARESLTPVISEIELASRFMDVPVIAVTGTNGKTTTTSLIAHILNENGIKAAACGNIGTPLSAIVVENRDIAYAVCEVSSFQLERIVAFKPFISVFLNLTPDHLDRYPSMKEYLDAKLCIFDNQGPREWAVVNYQYRELVSGIVERKKISGIYFNTVSEPLVNLFARDGVLYLNLHNREEAVCRRDEVRLFGEHNLENIFSGIAAGVICGVPLPGIASALRSFQAVPHRLEYVDAVAGVAFVNDSKGTNVDSVTVALKSFAGGIILIAGGRDKGGDFRPLRDLVAARVKAVIVIGEAADKIAEHLAGAAPVARAATLDEAVACGLRDGAAGDTVLLSPGCASFDMFRNYEHRGDEFRRIVRELKANNG